MRRLSIALMMLTIATIVAFQVYWLQRNYQDEKKLLNIRTNLLFRETVLNQQEVRLDLDTTEIRGMNPGVRTHVLHTAIRYKLGADSETFASQGQRVVIFRDDSIREPKNFAFISKDMLGPGFQIKLAGSLEALDSLRKPASIEEISSRFRRQLDREKLDIPFHVTRYPADTSGMKKILPDAVSMDNKVIIGIRKPLVYQMDLDHLPWFILRKIAPQILFSLVLVTVTVLSFLLLYRNWQQQKRLTQLKNDFISNITHELKTPIATVSVAVEALRNFNALDNPRRTQEYLDISAGELQRLSLLVDKVLKLSLFEKQEIELKKEPFNLKDLVEEVAVSMRLQFEKYQAKLQIEPEGPDTHGPDFSLRDFSLRADKLHIASVVYNLLDNALKYSKSQPFVRVGLRSETERLVLSVADNGIGIPSAYREKIFEKFFRVPTGDRHNVKGYGLGLSYVAYVLQRQGGEISVESEYGVGSRFTVKIPRDHV